MVEYNETNSEVVIDLLKARAKVQESVLVIENDAVNPHFKNKHPSLCGTFEAVIPVCTKNGIFPVQVVKGNVLVTTLFHASGQWIRGEMALLSSKNDMQGLGSAITYARRYSLLTSLGIVSKIDLDDDGNSASEPFKTESKHRKSPIATVKQRKYVHSLMLNAGMDIKKEVMDNMTVDDADGWIKELK